MRERVRRAGEGRIIGRGQIPRTKVWLITGTGRGLGTDIAKAALAAGHAVVATGRDPAKVTAAVGDHNNLLAIKLDVTLPQDAQGAVEAAVAKFGRIDIVVNNAGNFFAGFFEELRPEQVRHQIETLLFGPMNVTRAALPVMRKQRSGLIVTISSTAGITGLHPLGVPVRVEQGTAIDRTSAALASTVRRGTR
jgi:NAD(P)-dependent dehydrogenase (short-subunit alcohol dehydrogenase family)